MGAKEKQALASIERRDRSTAVRTASAAGVGAEALRRDRQQAEALAALEAVQRDVIAPLAAPTFKTWA